MSERDAAARKKTRRLWAAATIVLIATVAVIVTTRLTQEEPQGYTDVVQSLSESTKEAALTLEEQRTLRADFRAIQDATVPDIASGLMAQVHDPERFATSDMIERLSNDVAARVMAWASMQPSDYLRIAQSTGLLTPTSLSDDQYAPRIKSIYAFELGEEPTHEYATEALMDLWPRVMNETGFRWEKIGQGDLGLKVIIDRVRTPHEARRVDILALGEDLGHWTGAPVNISSMKMHHPTVSVEDYLTENEAATIAMVHMMVRFANGNVASVFSHWYWNERQGEWVHYDLNANVARPARLIM